MWSTFLTTLRINLREKSSLFWLFCFPILLDDVPGHVRQPRRDL